MSLFPLIIKSLQNSSMSLADLQQVTQVSLPTLRKATQELTDGRWIKVVGHSETNGGRPAMLFGLDDSFYAILGVHVQLPGMRMILADLNGGILDEVEYFQGDNPGPAEVVQAIVEYTEYITRQFPDRTLLGVGLAAPGFTDPETGDIISIERVPGWQRYPILQRVRASLGVPASIANDVDCMAFGEFQQAGKSFASNLAYIGFDEGIKVSLFLNGDLYKGSFGNSGLVVRRFLRVPDAEITAEEQDRLLSISGIVKLFEEEVSALSNGEKAAYEQILGASYRFRLRAIFAGSADNLPVCQNITERLNVVLAAAVANILYFVQPDTVVIGGALSDMPDTVFNNLSHVIRQHLPTLFANHVQIDQATMAASDSASLGAVYHFLDDYIFPGAFDSAAFNK